MGAHRDAVTEFAWRNSLVVSGDRQGILAFWDIEHGGGRPLRVAKAHGKAISKVVFYND